LNRRQYRRILRTLSAERPVFHESFDSVAIMKKEGRAWKVQTVIALSRSENRHEPAHVLEAEAVA
jgi:hypothetical protein